MDNSPKIYPSSHEQIAKVLHIDGEQVDSSPVLKQAPGPLDLPILEAEAKEITAPKKEAMVQEQTRPTASRPVTPKPPLREESVVAVETEEEPSESGSTPKNLRTFTYGAKVVLPYLAVFIVGVVLYYFYFSTFSFSDLFKQNGSSVSKSQKASALSQLEAANKPAYLAWMNQFYFQVNDEALLDPEADNSGNGLTNFQKFLLKLNPKAYDSLNLGMSDGASIVQGIDPLTGQPLTGSRKDIVNNYFDLEALSNRITLNSLNQPATAQASGVLLGARNSGASSAGKVNQTGQIGTAAITGRPTVAGESNVDINTSIPGTLDIPSMKISVPIIWSKDVKNFESDLTKGVIHYPGTAMPGEIGTSYISGHSSNYPWIKSNYNRIFSHLDQLTPGTSFTITVTVNSGQKVILHYVADHSQEFTASDQAQFANTADSVVALSTCWPVNTTAKRLVVFSKLTQVER